VFFLFFFRFKTYLLFHSLTFSFTYLFILLKTFFLFICFLF